MPDDNVVPIDATKTEGLSPKEYVPALFRELNEHGRANERNALSLYSVYVALLSAAIALPLHDNKGVLFFSTSYCLLVGLVSLLSGYHLLRYGWWKRELARRIAGFIRHYKIPVQELPGWMDLDRMHERLPGFHKYFSTSRLEYVIPFGVAIYCGLVVAYNSLASIPHLPPLADLFGVK